MHQFRHKPIHNANKLWVVTVVSNPARYKSRYELFQRFKTSMEKAGVNLLIVEVALGHRPFEMTETNNPRHIQLRTRDEMWHKENMINIGISRLPPDWEYVAWIDADVEFMRPDWPEEIVHQLQHFQVIQLFQTAIDLGPDGEVMKTVDGFAYSWINSNTNLSSQKGYYKGNSPYWHPGYAWAARRAAIESLGGLIDFNILGAADHHMAYALIGQVIQNTPKEVSAAYKKHLEIWQGRALKHIKKNIGFMPGSLYHYFHGKKADRKYWSRWNILFKHNFDPEYDLQRDWQGLYMFSDVGERMRNDIRQYFRQRNEDSIDL